MKALVVLSVIIAVFVACADRLNDWFLRVDMDAKLFGDEPPVLPLVLAAVAGGTVGGLAMVRWLG